MPLVPRALSFAHFLRFLFVLTIGAFIELSKQRMGRKAGQWRTECVFGVFCFLFL